MEIPDEWLYEYAIVRYVPRADRGEFINIGLLMMNKRKKWMKGKIFLDEIRLKNFFPLVNIDKLKSQCKLFEKQDVPSGNIPIEEKYRWLTAEKSATIRISPSHPGIVNIKNFSDMEDKDVLLKEFERLFHELVLPIT